MPAAKPALENGLLEEIERTVNRRTAARRADAVRRITDLFLAGAIDYSDEQISLFDDVFECLVRHIEVSSRALLANRLAPHSIAPPRIIHTLAFDDAIDVAAPVLTQSNRLSDEALIENARSKSQAHLLAISKRTSLSSAVTDVLIDQGDDDVVRSTVRNHGADLSEASFSRLVGRAEGNDELTIGLGRRPIIPRHHLLKLIAKASDTVRKNLQECHPAALQEVASVVGVVTDRARETSAAEDREVLVARALVGQLQETGELAELHVAEFARNNRFSETNAAIAYLADIPFTMVEAMMVESRSEGIMVLAKVLKFSWPTLKAVIDLRNYFNGAAKTEEAFTRAGYESLRETTARQILGSLQLQHGSRR